MKTCVHCHTKKHDSEFGKSKSNNDGLKSWCKKCCVDYRREWAKKHPERIKQFRKEDYEKHAEHYKEKAREWSAGNKQRKSIVDSIWRSKNKEQKTENDRKWRQTENGQSRRREAHLRRRAAKLGSGGNGITATQYDEIVKDPCVYCGSTEKITLDHIEPLSKGGLHDVSNAAPTCLSCNTKKGKKGLLRFLYDVKNGYKNKTSKTA